MLPSGKDLVNVALSNPAMGACLVIVETSPIGEAYEHTCGDPVQLIFVKYSRRPAPFAISRLSPTKWIRSAPATVQPRPYELLASFCVRTRMGMDATDSVLAYLAFT